VRNFQTTSVTRDIDSAAKFIGAGAATVGVAGSGMCNIERVLHGILRE
jgi:F-type H+-transporting ATPase subunit c